MTQEELDNAKLEIERHRLELERERWATEVQLRERELEIKSAEQRSRNTEIELKRQDQSRAGWWNPLVVAIFAAAIAAGGNAVVTIVNGVQQRNIEDQKSEQARILEMIKTGDAEKAAGNLQFLLDAGLIDNPERAQKVKAFLAARQPGTGPALPGGSIVGGIVGTDDAVDVNTLSSREGVRVASRSVGRLKVMLENIESVCTAFLVANDLALTAGDCTKGATSAVLELSDSGSSLQYPVQLPPIEEVLGPSGSFSLLRVSGKPGERWGTLPLSAHAPTIGEKLATVYFRGDATRKLAVSSLDCQIVRIEERLFHHGCDTGAGSSGAPVLSRDGLHVLGLHYSRSPFGGEAARADVILEAIKVHLEAK
jgi:V8-like Glu-specific endopeptidase